MRPKTLKVGKTWRKGRIKWCGPTALALITGRTLMHCQRMLASIKHTDQRYVRGCWGWEMKCALKRMGYQTWPLALDGKPTLRQYIVEQMPTREWKGTVLFETGCHYVVAHAGMVQDNHQIEPTPVADHPARRQRIQKGWLVTRIRKR